MPTTNNRNLTLTPSGPDIADTVAINVRYNAVFSPFERHLAANGLVFQERIVVLGMDGTVSIPLFTFPTANIPVTAGTAPQTIARNRTISRPRSNLVEDAPSIGRDGVVRFPGDEIRCRIEINPIGLPTPITALTDEERLPAVEV